MEDYTKTSKDFDQFLQHFVIDILKLTPKDFDRLLPLLKQLDINRWNAQKIKTNHHITTLKQEHNVSKNTQIDALLSYKATKDNGDVVIVCQIVKDMTLKMDYQWSNEGTKYC